MRRTDSQRFESSLIFYGDGCWLWNRRLINRGYGKFTVGKRAVLAHRWSYEHYVGPIPEGLQIDHLCSVARCVNPAHLEAVTPSENTRRAWAFRQRRLAEHCPSGHAYVADNTRLDSAGTRHCRTCDVEHAQRRSEKRRQARIDKYGFDPGPRARNAAATGHTRWNIDLDAAR